MKYVSNMCVCVFVCVCVCVWQSTQCLNVTVYITITLGFKCPLILKEIE